MSNAFEFGWSFLKANLTKFDTPASYTPKAHMADATPEHIFDRTSGPLRSKGKLARRSLSYGNMDDPTGEEGKQYPANHIMNNNPFNNDSNKSRQDNRASIQRTQTDPFGRPSEKEAMIEAAKNPIEPKERD